MYLLNASEVAAVMSPNQGQGQSSRPVTVEAYSEALLSVTARVEESLEVNSLSRATVVDYYQLIGNRIQNYNLSFSNVFISSELIDAPILANIDGLVLTQPLTFSYEDGSASLRIGRGAYSVTYVSGFAVDSDGVFIGVPEWLKSIAKSALVLEHRIRRGAAPNNVSFGELVAAQRRELYTRVSKRVYRPRIGVQFPIRTVRRDG